MIQQAIVRLLLPVILAILSCNNPSPGDQHTHPDTLAVAERADIIPAGLPAPDELSVFVPEHYSILDTAAGDLNLDKKDDLILVLKRNGEDTLVNTGEPDRPLLILIRDDHNRLQQVRRNDNTVYCIGCGGIMGTLMWASSSGTAISLWSTTGAAPGGGPGSLPINTSQQTRNGTCIKTGRKASTLRSPTK